MFYYEIILVLTESTFVYSIHHVEMIQSCMYGV